MKFALPVALSLTSALDPRKVLHVALVTLLGLSLLLLACNDDEAAQDVGVTPEVSAPTEAEPIPPEVRDASAEWPLPNRTYDNARMTTDSAIDSSTVDQLEVAWRFPMPHAADWGASATNPLIAGGRVYVQDLMSNVFALDLESGELIWESIRNVAAIGPNGVAIGWGLIYLQDGEDRTLALDLETGQEVWSTQLAASTGSQQPTAYGGFVYTGTGSGDPPDGEPSASGRESYTGGSGGHAYGLDHATGDIVWVTPMVEEGFWGNPEINSGAALWYPPAIDLETGRTFWGTGNPAPFPGTVDLPNAASRPGPNLYSNSIVALDGATGEMDWYNQVKPIDLFDLDFQGGPILATATIDEEERPIVIGYGKLGAVYAFDRETGEILWERPVGEHQNDTLESIPAGESVVVYPGVWGGVETPAAYADGVVYVATANLPTPWTATGFEAESGGEAVALGSGYTELNDGWAQAYAIDVDTGEVLWEHEFEHVVFAGMTVVNDLVFTSTINGLITALDRDSGSVVWEYQAPGGIISWPAVSGDHLVWPVGIGSEPQLLVLSLGGS